MYPPGFLNVPGKLNALVLKGGLDLSRTAKLWRINEIRITVCLT